jgi:two-component system, NarL family, invasion response regulator UvrY
MSNAQAPRYKVLLADDSSLVREKMRRLLTALPRIAICGEAANAQEAVAAIHASDADAVILDIDLHEGSGLDVLTALKEKASAPVVIILTIHAFEEMGRYYLEAGADHYFEKGADFDRLLNLLEKLSLETATDE